MTYQAHVLVTFLGTAISKVELNQANSMNAAWHFPPNATRITLLSSGLCDTSHEAFEDARNRYLLAYPIFAKDFPL